MAAEYELTLNDYLSIFKRRIWQILSIASAILIASILLAVLLPPIYQSTGTILVECNQEQVATFDLLQQGLAIASSRHSIA